MTVFNGKRVSNDVFKLDKALAMLRHCTGFFDNNGEWVSTWQNLVVTAVHDGAVVEYHGNPKRVQPVIKVYGR